tara:strand:+ start:2968 stop:3252 length:285 start_codon:yes stop_codon:yes gene_type:complete
MTFTFYYDAGHGWLEVSKDVLPTVGLSEDDFSAYSYKDRDHLYLEEDMDAYTFVKSWEIKHGDIKVKQRDDGHNSPIRELSRIEQNRELDTISF